MTYTEIIIKLYKNSFLKLKTYLIFSANTEKKLKNLWFKYSFI